MTTCNWEEIDSFRSMGEYRRFLRWIEAQVADGTCEELKQQEASGSEWTDRWFKCIATNEVWKLSCPDPGYFPGSWGPSHIRELPLQFPRP